MRVGSLSRHLPPERPVKHGIMRKITNRASSDIFAGVVGVVVSLLVLFWMTCLANDDVAAVVELELDMVACVVSCVL